MGRILLLICALWSLGCAEDPVNRLEEGNWKIRFTQVADWFCQTPTWRATVHADGRVEFEGRWCAEARGASQLDRDATREIKEAIEAARFLAHDNPTRRRCTADLEWAEMTVTTGGQSKTLLAGPHCELPYDLSTLSATFQRVVRPSQWLLQCPDDKYGCHDPGPAFPRD